ncbi:cytochrome c [uncultured Microbulbifer sp.]|uniref:c-type cytochrome n=1 Tax=uncultured Microbulbifer sp. TaxID=348147 RepID=UPI00261CB889|nr:cytochrome c [uncultured Microbulbifer sp.]
MPIVKYFLLAVLLSVAEKNFSQEDPNLGKTLGNKEITRWSITIYPSGEGLPAGSGNAKEGETLYAVQCRSCHGATGTEGPATRLSGTAGFYQDSTDPLRALSVGAWPNATTIFDYIRRGMPHFSPKSLNNEEVYQLVAYILFLNQLIEKTDALNADKLITITMPEKYNTIDVWAQPDHR